MKKKLTVEEIKMRFETDIERFSSLETAQESTVDALYVLDLIATVAVSYCPDAKSILDIGCGAGNYTLKILQKIKAQKSTLIDLSRPMLEKAAQRIYEQSHIEALQVQGDIRNIDLNDSYDIVTAAAVLHHLRSDNEWKECFKKIYNSISPGGIFLASDLIAHETITIQSVTSDLYGDYLTSLKGTNYRDAVFSCIEEEDTPRSLEFQIECSQEAGFSHVEILHKNMCYGAFAAIK